MVNCLSDISIWFELVWRPEFLMSSDWYRFGLRHSVVIYYWTNFGKPHYSVNISGWLDFEMSSYNTDRTAEAQTSRLIQVAVAVGGSCSVNRATVIVVSCLLTVYHVSDTCWSHVVIGPCVTVSPRWCQSLSRAPLWPLIPCDLLLRSCQSTILLN